MFIIVLFILEKQKNPLKCLIRRNGYQSVIPFINGILCSHKNSCSSQNMCNYMGNSLCYRKCEKKDNHNCWKLHRKSIRTYTGYFLIFFFPNGTQCTYIIFLFVTPQLYSFCSYFKACSYHVTLSPHGEIPPCLLFQNEYFQHIQQSETQMKNFQIGTNSLYLLEDILRKVFIYYLMTIKVS